MKEIAITYIDNVNYIDIGTVNWDADCSIECFIKEIIGCLVGYGIENPNPSLLRIVSNGVWEPISKELLEEFENINIVYYAAVAPNGAAEFDRVEGLVFFFHTEEGNHLFFPHIHVRYGDEEIRIALQSFEVMGRFKTPQKEKKAVKYVKDNQEKLMMEWNRIINREN